MLSLSRKVGESIYIGDDIIITVQSVKGGSVSLNLQVPDDVNIVRAEIRGKYTPEEIAERRASRQRNAEDKPSKEVSVGFVGQKMIDLTRKS